MPLTVSTAPAARVIGSTTCAALMFLLCACPVAACNGPPPPSVADALGWADVVLVAKVVSIRQSPVEGDTSGHFVTEDATFKVIEVFKGPYLAGNLLHTHSELGPYGPCGLSALNKPEWLVNANDQPILLSGTWLIYGRGGEPYELGSFGRTAPMEAGGETDVKELRRLVERASEKSSTITSKRAGSDQR